MKENTIFKKDFRNELKTLPIILVFAFATSGFVFSQNTVESKKMVLYAPFKSFFENHPSVERISFTIHKTGDSIQLHIFERTNGAQPDDAFFDFKHAGYRYFFQKKYDALYFPATLYQRFLDKNADLVNIEGIIRKDTVLMTITQTYYKKTSADDDEQIFEKVEMRADYEKGMHVFAKEMQVYFQQKSFNDIPQDSVFIFNAIVYTNKTIKVETILTGNSSYANSMIKFINASGPWTPLEACGRKVKAYMKIYARLNKDNSFTVELY